MEDNKALENAEKIVLLIAHEIITKKEAREMLGLESEKGESL